MAEFMYVIIGVAFILGAWKASRDNVDNADVRCETDAEGTKRWKNAKGEYHRTDGPAIKRADEGKSWYQNNRLHRLDGPAIEYANGYKEWHVNGNCHRTDGPAIEYANGYKEWWIDGVRFTEEEFLAQSVTMTTDEGGNKQWKNSKGELHREGEPAVEYADGTKAWYQNGHRHREDGPAIECADGSKSWWTKNVLHRLDGPAVEWANGNKAWYIDGQFLTKREFLKQQSLKTV